MRPKICLFFFLVNFLFILGLNSKSITLEKNLVIDESSDLLFSLSSLDVDEDGNIYIADFKTYFISKFNKYGEFIKKSGRRGAGPGEFPGSINLIKYSDGKLFITIKNMPTIFVFDKELNFLYFIRNIRNILSFIVKRKRILILSPDVNNALPIIEMNLKGNIKNRYKVNSTYSSVLWTNWKAFTIDRNNNFYIVSYFEDKLEKWDENYKKIWSIELFSGQKIKYKKSRSGELIPDVKKTFYYKNIVFDSKGNLFVLSGDKAVNKRQDVYVISKSGNKLLTFTLPNPTSFISIDKENNIYTKGQNGGLVRYKIKYEY